MRTKITAIISSLSLIGVLFSAPPVLNVYVIPFDNIKNDVAIGWLSDAFAEMVNAELTEQDRIYLKGKEDLEEIMTTRSLLLQKICLF